MISGKDDSATAGAVPFDSERAVAPAMHAPGPWRMEGPLKPGRTYRISSARGLVTYVGDPATMSFDHANARLIAAAPALLKVAKQMAASYFREYPEAGYIREGHRCLECGHEGTMLNPIVHDGDCEVASTIAQAEGWS